MRRVVLYVMMGVGVMVVMIQVMTVCIVILMMVEENKRVIVVCNISTTNL